MDHAALVISLMAKLGKSAAAMRAAMLEAFTDDTRWENVGLSVTIGKEAAIALIDQFEEAMGLDRIEVEMLALATQGATVLTERIDHLLARDGSVICSIPIMGIFEFTNDKITAWRDYFDTAAFGDLSLGKSS